MTAPLAADPPPLDVLIIGAGLSGIGAARHLQHRCPRLTWSIVEARADLGGTWDLFRYPGIRSDSDLYTFGYDFKPWTGANAIADGPSIKAYIAETARETGVDRHIRFRRRVVDADWSSTERAWRATLRDEDSGATEVVRARWLFNATGYYRYDRGHAPTFPDQDRFEGRIVHPQHWPEDLDWTGQRVVIIGSGATAVTMLPAMADRAAHVTMLQRTPGYVMPVPEQDPVARRLRPWLGERRTHAITRRINIAKQRWVFALCKRYPDRARRLIRRVNAKFLPPGYPVDVHFNPPYDPWDQRLCAVPGADLFRAIASGRASVVTDHVERFLPRGIRLRSGAELEADLIVTATGLELLPLGGLPLRVDGVPVRLPEHVTYKGMMLSDVPNFATAVGYTSSSWTLKIGLLCEHFCALLNHMDAKGLAVCTPRAPADLRTQPMLNFGAGYVQRSIDALPKQGDRHPWLTSWDYASDAKRLRHGRVDDPALEFVPQASAPQPDTAVDAPARATAGTASR